MFKIKLTDIELELIKYLTDGLTNSQIATKMFLTTATIKAHMTTIMKKMSVKNRVSVAVIAVVIGLADYRNIKFLKPFLNNDLKITVKTDVKMN